MGDKLFELSLEEGEYVVGGTKACPRRRVRVFSFLAVSSSTPSKVRTLIVKCLVAFSPLDRRETAGA